MPFYYEGNKGTIRPNPSFNGEEACVKLNDSMEGLGTDERALTDIVLAHSHRQRQDIRKMYWDIYDRDVLKQIESELSFSYLQIILALMADPQEYILHCINEAVTLTFGEGIMKRFQKATYRKGIGADEYTLISLLLLRSNREIDEIKKAYRKKYKKYLEKRIAGSHNLSLDFRRLIIAMIDCKREENYHVDGDQIFKDVMNIMSSNKKEEAFHVVMHERSFTHLVQLFDGYKAITGKSIEDMIISSNFSLDLKEAYIAILTLLRNPVEFFAMRLHDAIEGAGTDDDTLIQVMVLRSEVDLADIIETYERKYNVPLAKDIQGDTSGDYEDVLLKLCRIPPPLPTKKKAAVNIPTEYCHVDEDEVPNGDAEDSQVGEPVPEAEQEASG